VGELQRLGWSEGRNLHIEYYWATGDRKQIRAAAKNLVDSRPDVIVTNASPGIAALMQETRTVPIVFASGTDPVGQGFVESLARPGGNATGFTSFEFSMGGKWLEILKEIAPSVVRVALIFNPATIPGGGVEYVRSVMAAAPSFAVRPVVINTHDLTELEEAIAQASEPGSGIVLLPDVFTVNHRRLVVDRAERHRVPAIYAFRSFVTDGGLVSYGSDLVDLFRRSAEYIDRILKGAKPADLPVQQPTKFELALNLKTARALGIEVSPMLLARADEVIE
jgi:putative ABC transport system substrate-binding protein